jgi:hypothetical protein
MLTTRSTFSEYSRSSQNFLFEHRRHFFYGFPDRIPRKIGFIFISAKFFNNLEVMWSFMAGSDRSVSLEMNFRFPVDDFDILSSPVTSRTNYLSDYCFKPKDTNLNIFDLLNLNDFQIPLSDEIVPFPPPPPAKFVGLSTICFVSGSWNNVEKTLNGIWEPDFADQIWFFMRRHPHEI